MADVLCRRARAKEVQYDALREEANRLVVAGARCEGAMGEYRNIDQARMTALSELVLVKQERDSRVHKLWVVGGVVAGLALGGTVGYLVSR